MRTYAIFSDFFDIAVKRAIFVVMEEDLKTAVEVMRKGGVILYPTDTIWGIGCDATNAEAVDKVYKIKKRANNKAMLVLVGKMEDVENYVETVPEMAYQLNELSEKPITIIYDNALNLAGTSWRQLQRRHTGVARGVYTAIVQDAPQANRFYFRQYRRRAFASILRRDFRRNKVGCRLHREIPARRQDPACPIKRGDAVSRQYN